MQNLNTLTRWEKLTLKDVKWSYNEKYPQIIFGKLSGILFSLPLQYYIVFVTYVSMKCDLKRILKELRDLGDILLYWHNDYWCVV